MITSTTIVNEVAINTLEEPGYYNLTTVKGKEVLVTFSMGRVWVKNNNAAAKAYRMSSGNLLGKPFACLADAVESYKNADIKHALRVLLSELV